MSQVRLLEERECVERCKCIEHGELVCATLTKRQALDSELCAYLQHICCSCESVKDSVGRTALHVAASCGRCDVVKWLVRMKHANINIKDNESGYTPLHRSIFYGKINVAVYLIKLGANMTLTDYNGLTSLEHAMNDCWKLTEPYDASQGEVYVWGSNTNYTLGPQQARLMPELLDAYHKEYPNLYVNQICLEKFHCILVSTDGKIFACGHGQGGRLGLSVEKTVLAPKLVKLSASGHTSPVICKKASIAIDHSVFLSESGHVWTCGLNTHRVLGVQPPPTQSLTPCPLPLTQHQVEDVCAARYHTVVWGPSAIYSWGLHGGQLGHDKNPQKYIITPKLVTCLLGVDNKITAVAASNGATAVVTQKGDIYVLHEYQCRKIASKQLNITSISVVGGKLNEKIENSLSSEENHELTVVGLSNVGNIYIWQEANPQFARCIFSVNRALKIRQITLNLNEVLFVTYTGEAFQGILKPRKRKTTENNLHIHKSAFHEFLEKDNCQLLKVTKIPRIHRAVSIHSDLKGRNYAVLQASPKALVTKVPEISDSTIQDHMYLLLRETVENDGIHDIIFKVGNRAFPVHHYIIMISSSRLGNLITASVDKIIELSNVHPDIFEQLLLFIYTGTCDLIKAGKCPDKLQLLCKKKKEEELEKDNDPEIIKIEKSCTSAFQCYKDAKSKSKSVSESETAKDPVRLLQETAKRFGVKTLQRILDNVIYDDNGYILLKKEKYGNAYIKPKFERTGFPELQDVVLKTKEKKEISAHKCILVARLEYFNNLFSVRWTENSTTKEVSLPFPYAVLYQLIEYLYTDELPLLDKEDIDHICHLLIIADQLFVLRLKEICECTLCSFVTLKNVVQILSFSSIYNAEQLKIYCMEFVCLNLAAVLESKSLEFVDEDILHELTEFYCKYNPIMQQRIITPYSYAPSDEIVSEANSLYHISFEDSDCENNSGNKSKSQKKRSRGRKSGSADFNKKEHNFDNIETFSQFEGTNVRNEIESMVANEQLHASQTEGTCLSKIESRVKAIVIARDKMNYYNVVTEYTKLPLKSSITEASLTDFPELNSHNSSGTYSKSPNKSERIDIKQKITKLSQKQRKRLSSESSSNAVEPCSPILSESPRNPWKICTEFSKSPVGSPDSITINSIITDEKRQKENLVKMKTKLLVHTQMEDKAIEDLHKFYNVDNVFDEIFTINRVQIGSVASPVWVHASKAK